MASFWNRAAWIEDTLPYPRHIDERFVSVPALRVLQSGSPDPGFFRYPTLPIYLASLGMGVGTWIAVLRGEADAASDVTSVEAPYYSHPTVMAVPRVVHAALAAATLLLVAAIGHRMLPSPAMWVLGPAVLAVNGYYHEEGWLYLNVDMLASFFALATTLQLLRGAERPSLRSLVLGPALLCGATIACKYPSGLIGVPALLAVRWYAPAERRWRWMAVLVLAAAAAFVLFCPYSVLSFDRFLTDVLKEVRHYATGREHGEAEPGLEQMRYYGAHLLRYSGGLLPALAGIGLAAAWRRDWRRTLLLALFPLLLFALLSTQRTHFHRNWIPAYGMLAVAAGLGLHAVHAWLVARLRPLGRPRGAAWLAGIALGAAVVWSVPLRNVPAFLPRPDSRNDAASWIAGHLDPGSTLVVPEFANFSEHGIPASIRVVRATVRSDPVLPRSGDCFVVAPDLGPPATAPAAREHAVRRLAWLEEVASGEPLAVFGERPLGRSAAWAPQTRIRILRCRAP